MQQICQHCGYDSPGSDRFCRQCGGSLSAETEVSSATTRNYGRQEAAPSVIVAGSGRLPPSVGDAIAGETERYYQAPRPSMTPTQNTAPIKSRFRPWRLILMLLVLIIGAAVGAAVTASLTSDRRPSLPPEEIARMQSQREAQRRQEEYKRRIEDKLREAQDRSREASERQREALERAREAAERARDAGAALTVTTEKPIDLSQYEYTGATVSRAIRIPGHEMLTMNTPDSFDSVNQFFQKKFGKPIIQINNPIDEWGKKLIFQSDTAPPISVSVEPDDENNGQLKITILRLPFWIPKPVEAGNPK
jgi:hypothetical protein